MAYEAEPSRQGDLKMPRLSELKVKLFTDGADKTPIVDHLGFNLRGLQCDRGRRHGLPHHHRAR
jgi:hypothetical protein